MSEPTYDGKGSQTRTILHIGKIGRAHGLLGEVKVSVLSSDPDRFDGLTGCLLVTADEKQQRPVRIISVRPASGQVIIKLDGIDDRTQAERLTGAFLSVPREQAIALQDDEWFVCDLTGCTVRDEKDGDLGTLIDILAYRAQDIYVVRKAGQADLLFPALKSVIRRIDLEKRLILVQLPDGLYEVYRGKES